MVGGPARKAHPSVQRKQRQSARIRKKQKRERQHLEHTRRLLHSPFSHPPRSVHPNIACPNRPAKPLEAHCPKERIERLADLAGTSPRITLHVHGEFSDQSLHIQGKYWPARLSNACRWYVRGTHPPAAAYFVRLFIYLSPSMEATG